MFCFKTTCLSLFFFVLRHRVIHAFLYNKIPRYQHYTFHFAFFDFHISGFFDFCILLFLDFWTFLFLDFSILLFLDFCILPSEFPSQVNLKNMYYYHIIKFHFYDYFPVYEERRYTILWNVTNLGLQTPSRLNPPYRLLWGPLSMESQ